MTTHWPAVIVCAATGAVAAAFVARRVLRPSHPALYRTNVSGTRVPVVLGAPVVLGGLVGMVPGPFVLEATESGVAGAAAEASALVVLMMLVMAYAGLFDDLRGEERWRGLAGHLAAARSGRLSGGVVKTVAGAGAGLAAGFYLESGWEVLPVAGVVALTANLINLLDRAPGRASKAWLLVAVPVGAFGSPAWAVAAAGVTGAVVACLPLDLRERAMLGDAGANPLGAVAGLGVAMAFGAAGRLAALGILAALTLASERYSFSDVIESIPGLRAFDRLGRP
jgi:hypothetical protein